jgi:hypothetical protein
MASANSAFSDEMPIGVPPQFVALHGFGGDVPKHEDLRAVGSMGIYRGDFRHVR